MTAVVIGIDVGGSKTHGLLSRDGVVLAESVRGTANPSSIGLDAAARELDLLVDDLLAGDPSVPVAGVCVGAAGVESDDARARLRDVVGRRLPGVAVQVVHDTELVLAAAGLDEGVVVVSGTGSAAWGRTRSGEQVRTGGWGYLLGDAGSGYGIVRAAVQHVLDRADDGLAPDALTRAVLGAAEVADAPSLLDAFYARPDRREWASRAGVVLDLAASGDQAAASLVGAAAAELVQAATRVARRLDLSGPVVLAGGLAVNNALLRDAVGRGLAPHGITDVRPLTVPPALGAVRLAARFHRSTAADVTP